MLPLALAVVAVLLFGSLAAVGAGPNSPGANETGSASLRSASTSYCSDLTTNASLEALVAGHYPNASLEPSETTASASIAQIWGSVCTSSTLFDAESQASNVSFAVSVFVGDSNGTGDSVASGSLFVQFSIAWAAACPNVSSAYPAGYPCNFSDGWTGNLTTGAIAGPVLGVVSVRYAGCSLAANSYLVGTVNAAYPDASLHPNQTVADSRVQAIWGEVCRSLPFYQATLAHPGLGLALEMEVSGAFTNQTGPGNETLSVSWDFVWTSACPAGNASYPAGATCENDEGWGANLATGNWSGPTTRVYLAVSTGLPSGLGSRPCLPCSSSGFPVYLTVGLAAAGILAVAGVILLRTRGRPGPGPIAPAGDLAGPTNPPPAAAGGTEPLSAPDPPPPAQRNPPP